MNDQFLIIDNRPIDTFKTKTFSGFKKNEVFKVLFDSISKQKIENALHWTTECIISGYLVELLDKLLSYASKKIHINHPNLPTFLLKKYNHFYRIIEINLKKTSEKNEIIHYRNNQCIRNLFFNMVITIIQSPKTKKYDEYPKIDPNIDFDFDNIKKRLIATANYVPDNMVKFTDPEELRIIINEIIYQFNNQTNGYEIISYWICWIIQWEKLNRKKKIKCEIEQRNISGVRPNHCKDILWLVWHCLLYESEKKSDNVKEQIRSLYLLYKTNFTPSKKSLRIPFIFNALGFLTNTIKWLPLRNNLKLFIDSQINANYMFHLKKQNETNIELVEKEKNKKNDIQKEIVNDKLLLLLPNN